MLAPFWTDVSTNANTHVWYHLYNRYDPDPTTIDFLDIKVKEFLQNNFHDNKQVVNFEPHTALKVTWENILPNPIVTNAVSVFVFYAFCFRFQFFWGGAFVFFLLFFFFASSPFFCVAFFLACMFLFFSMYMHFPHLLNVIFENLETYIYRIVLSLMVEGQRLNPQSTSNQRL